MRIWLALLAVSAFSGCANTALVKRAQGVAETGRAYVTVMGKVNDLVLDRSVTFTAGFLAGDAARDVATFEGLTEGILSRARLVAEHKAYLAALGSYFSELEALANGDQSEATAAALGALADSLKNAPVRLKLNDKEKGALTGLAGYVARQVHAAAVEKALHRDADTVAQAIEVGNKMLAEQIRQIEIREELVRARDFEQKVRGPFLKLAALDDAWKKAWIDQVRTPPTIALLQEARQSSLDMQKAWRDVLRADYSFAEIRASLDNVRAGIEALSAVREAR